MIICVFRRGVWTNLPLVEELASYLEGNVYDEQNRCLGHFLQTTPVWIRRRLSLKYLRRFLSTLHPSLNLPDEILQYVGHHQRWEHLKHLHRLTRRDCFRMNWVHVPFFPHGDRKSARKMRDAALSLHFGNNVSAYPSYHSLCVGHEGAQIVAMISSEPFLIIQDLREAPWFVKTYCAEVKKMLSVCLFLESKINHVFFFRSNRFGETANRLEASPFPTMAG